MLIYLASVLNTPEPKSKKKSASKKNLNKDFNIEYAKSGRAGCCGCQEKIVKVKLFYDTLFA